MIVKCLTAIAIINFLSMVFHALKMLIYIPLGRSFDRSVENSQYYFVYSWSMCLLSFVAAITYNTQFNVSIVSLVLLLLVLVVFTRHMIYPFIKRFLHHYEEKRYLIRQKYGS